jgi:DNA-binding NarL/FixJ family response regulator
MNWAYILSTASLVLCVLFFLYFRWYLKRRTALRGRDAAETLLAEYRAEVYRLIADIDAATDRDALLVEERITSLRKLLEDTDRRIAVYVRELNRSRSGEALYTSLGRGIRAALEPQIQPPPPGPAEEAPQAQSAAAAGKKRKTRPPTAAGAKPQLKTHIAELAAQGLSPGEIASRLDISLSEVDLALSLLGKR